MRNWNFDEPANIERIFEPQKPAGPCRPFYAIVV